jgi:hypothetical protein
MCDQPTIGFAPCPYGTETRPFVPWSAAVSETEYSAEAVQAAATKVSQSRQAMGLAYALGRVDHSVVTDFVDTLLCEYESMPDVQMTITRTQRNQELTYDDKESIGIIENAFVQIHLRPYDGDTE